ncbi:MAG: hypothetical protein AVDCRST_MAG59-2298, partial [uncultured Thermomicrobiales bacterium]
GAFVNPARSRRSAQSARRRGTRQATRPEADRPAGGAVWHLAGADAGDGARLRRGRDRAPGRPPAEPAGL